MQPALVGYESRAGYKRVAGSRRRLPVRGRRGRLGTPSEGSRGPGQGRSRYARRGRGVLVRVRVRAGQQAPAAHVAGDLGGQGSGWPDGEKEF